MQSAKASHLSMFKAHSSTSTSQFSPVHALSHKQLPLGNRHSPLTHLGHKPAKVKLWVTSITIIYGLSNLHVSGRQTGITIWLYFVEAAAWKKLPFVTLNAWSPFHCATVRPSRTVPVWVIVPVHFCRTTVRNMCTFSILRTFLLGRQQLCNLGA